MDTKIENAERSTGVTHCPNCGKHCPIDAVSCGRGEAFAEKLKMGGSEPKQIRQEPAEHGEGFRPGHGKEVHQGKGGHHGRHGHHGEEHYGRHGHHGEEGGERRGHHGDRHGKPSQLEAPESASESRREEKHEG